MQIQVLTELINQQLADEIVTTAMLQVFMDSVIDDINAKLNAKFPTITEWLTTNSDTSNYTAIPDRYLRSVVVPGAAFKYYVMDEEGTYAAPKYEQQYREALFIMLRDYSMQIPAEYRAEDPQGYIQIAGSDAGLIFPGNVNYD